MSRFKYKAPTANAPLQNWFEGQLQNEENRTTVYEMLHAGDTLEDIIPKCHLADENEAKLIALAVGDIIDDEMDSEREMLKMLLLAKNSVHGRSRYEALQGSSGVVDSNYWSSGQGNGKNGDHHKKKQPKVINEGDEDDE